MKTEKEYTKAQANFRFATKYGWRADLAFICDDPSLTQQHFKDESDINKIVSKYHSVDELPVSKRRAIYGDFTGIPDDLNTILSTAEKAHSAVERARHQEERSENAEDERATIKPSEQHAEGEKKGEGEGQANQVDQLPPGTILYLVLLVPGDTI